MPDSLTRTRRAHRHITGAASAVIAGLCAALPMTGATFLLALGASCLAESGCSTPTFIDHIVPIAGISTWVTVALIAASRLRSHDPHFGAHPLLRGGRR